MSVGEQDLAVIPPLAENLAHLVNIHDCRTIDANELFHLPQIRACLGLDRLAENRAE
jgi:hypothetical protein